MRATKKPVNCRRSCSSRCVDAAIHATGASSDDDQQRRAPNASRSASASRAAFPPTVAAPAAAWNAASIASASRRRPVSSSAVGAHPTARTTAPTSVRDPRQRTRAGDPIELGNSPEGRRTTAIVLRDRHRRRERRSPADAAPRTIRDARPASRRRSAVRSDPRVRVAPPSATTRWRCRRTGPARAWRRRRATARRRPRRRSRSRPHADRRRRGPERPAMPPLVRTMSAEIGALRIAGTTALRNATIAMIESGRDGRSGADVMQPDAGEADHRAGERAAHAIPAGAERGAGRSVAGRSACSSRPRNSPAGRALSGSRTRRRRRSRAAGRAASPRRAHTGHPVRAGRRVALRGGHAASRRIGSRAESASASPTRSIRRHASSNASRSLARDADHDMIVSGKQARFGADGLDAVDRLLVHGCSLPRQAGATGSCAISAPAWPR